MKICLVISSLSSGGAERVMSSMANYWALEGHEITLITISSPIYDFYKLHASIKRVSLGEMPASKNYYEALKNNLKRLMCLRREIASIAPDVVISFMDRMNVLVLTATSGLRVPVIVSERTDPRYHKIGKIWCGFRYLTYRRANAVVVQTKAIQEWGQSFINREKICVIPNPVSITHGFDQSISKEPNTIVSMGRLGPEKGFDLLIKAFSKCLTENPTWKLVIWGEGAERNRLKDLVDTLGIEEKVKLPGRVQNPFEAFRKGEIFILSSRYEGFPNVLLEAMACGLPVISFNCPSGPSDIIIDGLNGILVSPEDVDTLAKEISGLMNNEKERNRMSLEATKVLEAFNIDKIMNMWMGLISRYVNR